MPGSFESETYYLDHPIYKLEKRCRGRRGELEIRFVSIEVQIFWKNVNDSFTAIYLRDRTEYINKLIMKSLIKEKKDRITQM